MGRFASEHGYVHKGNLNGDPELIREGQHSQVSDGQPRQP
jgi:hypothetical protein